MQNYLLFERLTAQVTVLKRQRPLHALKLVHSLLLSLREGFIKVCSLQLFIELSPNGMPVKQGLIFPRGNAYATREGIQFTDLHQEHRPG
jgi:hypothetical protein